MKTKIYKFLFPVLFGFMLSFGFLAFLRGQPALARAGVRYVAPGGACNGVSPCYATVQAAVDEAAAGDEIRVAAGVYTDTHIRPRQDYTTTGVVTQVVYLSKTVDLLGGYSLGDWENSDPQANPTRLDAQGRGRVIYVTGEVSPTIAGFEITGGDASGLGGDRYFTTSGSGSYVYIDCGGGVYGITATLTIRENRIFSNTATDGGGISLSSPRPVVFHAVVSGNEIFGNTAEDEGGGMSLLVWKGHIIFERNIVSANHATSYGGGLLIADRHSIITIGTARDIAGRDVGNQMASNTNFDTRIALHDNRISANVAGGSGGGLQCIGISVEGEGNGFYSNHAHTGGGMEAEFCQTRLARSLIIANTASSSGGGAYFLDEAIFLTNSLISGNETNEKGNGLLCFECELSLSHVTLANNTGGDGSGIYIKQGFPSGNFAHITNTIIASQTIGIVIEADNAGTINGVLWYNNAANVSGEGAVTVTHAITGSPAFAADGYHLTAGSAAINNGVPSGVLGDYDNEPRPYLEFDLGADEFWPAGVLQRVFLPLITLK